MEVNTTADDSIVSNELSFMLAEKRQFSDDDEYENDEFDEAEISAYTEVSSKENCSNAMNGADAPDTGAMVFLRFRPVEQFSKRYVIADAEISDTLVIKPLQDCNNHVNGGGVCGIPNKFSKAEKHFKFSHIFDMNINQADIYEKCYSGRVLRDESLTVMVYGTSGSGKTFTLLGDAEQPGILARCLVEIFTRYQNFLNTLPCLKVVNGQTLILDEKAIGRENSLKHCLLAKCKELDVKCQNYENIIRKDHGFETLKTDDFSVLIWITFVEIYNENVYDLLGPVDKTVKDFNGLKPNKLRINYNNGNVYMKDVTSIYVNNISEALMLLFYGLEHVTYDNNSINEHSSRSHCIFQLNVVKCFSNGMINTVSFKFCDLAGSERQYKTNNTGNGLKEAQRINLSLAVLGRCLKAATNINRRNKNKITNIPIRESKLTLLLQSALQGKEKLIMIANVTPTDAYFEENMTVLNFASITRNILFKKYTNPSLNVRYSGMIDCTQNKTENSTTNFEQKLILENAVLREELDQTILNYEHEIKIMREEHLLEMNRQEHRLRNELNDWFQSMYSDYKTRKKLYLEREIERQKTFHKSELEYFKSKCQRKIEDLENLKDENEGLKDEIEDLKDEIQELRSQLEGRHNQGGEE